MACDCTPEWSDGEVMSFVWGNEPKAMVLINACGVKVPDTYYANYTWDPTTGTLHFTVPTKTIPPSPGQPPRSATHRFLTMQAADQPTIRTLDIECWGTSPVAPPTVWSGELSGTASITFVPNGSISGPVGTVNYP
jgi:hypothetical protein